MRILHIALVLLAIIAVFGSAAYAVEESAVEESAVEESAVEESAVEESAVEEPAAEEPAAEEPAAEEPAAEEPAAEEVDYIFDKEFEALLLEEEDVQVYKFPKIKPEYSLSLGYRMANSSGSRSAGEYEHLDDSIMFAGELRMFKFPQRVYLMFDEESTEDYFGDARYAYGDKVFFRWLGRSLFHNTGRIDLVDVDTTTNWLSVQQKDTKDDLGIKMAADNLFLRLKVPNYAAHAFVDYYSIRKDGSKQQRGLLGSGYYNNAVMTTWEREIDWKGEAYKVGANSHLGPVEAELVFAQKRFDPGEGDIYDSYTASGLRAAGKFPHHRVSELEGSSGTLKLHTSYTGRLVASAKVSLKERENVSSNTKADYLVGTGGVTLMPMTSLTLFLRYKHLEIQRDNPETVTLEDADSTYQKTYNVKTSLDSISDTVSLAGRYRPLRWVVLRGRYLYEDTRRKKADIWEMEEDTTKGTASFSVDLDLPGHIDLRTEYMRMHTENPTYNTQSDESDEGTVALAWSPLPTINTSLSYTRGNGVRGILLYEDDVTTDDREVKSDKVFWTGTSALRKNLSLSASYTYLSNETIQDLAVGSEVAYDSSYTDLAHSYFLGADYSPLERLDLHGGASFTISKGEFVSNSVVFNQPVDVAILWDYRFTEMSITASGDYRLGRNLNAGLEYDYIKLTEVLETPHNEIEDGDVQIVMIRISNKWQ
jgi:hypothetical protein